MAATVKSTMDIRRTIRGQDVNKSEKEVNVNLNLTGGMERLADALTDATLGRPMLKAPKSKRIAVEIGDAYDTDEELEDSIEDNSTG